MGIETCGWEWDTELMARFVNENFMTYSLADMIRIYVPEMAGYSDYFDSMVNKSDMMSVPPTTIRNEKGEITTIGMDEYAGGDSDATLRLAQALIPQMKADPANLKVFRLLHMRALVALTKTTETYGFNFNTTALDEFETEITDWLKQETRMLKRMVPAAVRRKYLTDPKGFSFSRSEVMTDILFQKCDQQGNWYNHIGFNLTPQVFTDSTATDPDWSQRKPSTSTKTHLPYFLDAPGNAGEFVRKYTEVAKATKMLDTYIKGMRKVVKNGPNNQRVLLPQYNFKTNTKRTQSQDHRRGSDPCGDQVQAAFA